MPHRRLPGPLAFTNIIESSGTDAVPLFGSPSVPLVGSPPNYSVGLEFNPTSFAASATSGQADITDGQLNFRIGSTGPVSYGFRDVRLTEFGDYTLVGSGTVGTSVFGGARMFVTIREVNGVAVTPVTVSGVYSFTDDLSGGSEFLNSWASLVAVNLGPELAYKGFGEADVVTLADVVIDNSLIAISEAASVAFIAKKNFIVSVAPQINPVPLPASVWGLLSGIGLLMGRAAARRRATE